MGRQPVNINQTQAATYNGAVNNNTDKVKIKGLAGLKVLSIINAIILAFSLFLINISVKLSLLTIVASCIGIYCKSKALKMQNTEDVKSLVKTGLIACWVGIISFIINTVVVAILAAMMG